MIVEFSVGNFRSIKDIQTINLSAASITSKYKEVDEHNLIQVSDKLSLLKSKAIYGANASGKSNFMKALLAFKVIVDRSLKDETILGMFVEPFQFLQQDEETPSFFQLIFIVNGVIYRYGFEATKDEIKSEWLFGTPGKKEVFYFTREQDEIKVNEAKFPEASRLNELFEGKGIVRKNALFLSVVKSFNGELAQALIGNIMHISLISGIDDPRLSDIARAALEDEVLGSKMAEILKLADTGIEKIEVVELPATPRRNSKDASSTGNKIILTTHKVYNEANEAVDETLMRWEMGQSDGTMKIFEISPFLLLSLQEGHPIFIDEFDARLHPLLTRKIVELFNAANNKNAQLIFITHDVNLLSARLFRRDQISFVEKDKFGNSGMYSLVDFKGIRNDASFDKDYMQGKYGAIPFLNEFMAAFED